MKKLSNLEFIQNVVMPAISLIGFLLIAGLVLYNSIHYGVGGTCVTGW